MDTRLRLLVLTDTPIMESGGSERFLRNLLGLLPAEHYVITLVQLCAEPVGARRLHLHPEALELRMHYLPVAAVYGWGGWRAFRTLRRLVRQEGFHIVQSQHEKSDIFNALLPRGPLHAARVSNRRDTGFQKSQRLRKLFRFLNGRYDRIVAPATAILESVAHDETAPHARMCRIPNGVDTERFRPADETSRAQMRAQLGFEGNEFLIGCVAAMTTIKRHNDLIAAFVGVLRTVPHAHLLLVGDGPLHTNLEAQIAAAGIGSNVRLCGDVSDVAALLPALDACTLVSETEGMSNAILEAMACGLPVVATAVGGNPELVDHGRTGLLVSTRDPAALAAALERLACDAAFARACGAAARARAMSEFSLAGMVRAFQQMYHELRSDDSRAA